MKNRQHLAPLLCVLALVACSDKSADRAVSTPEPVNAMAEPVGKPQKVIIGVAPCDEFLDKYRACFARLPTGLQDKMKNGLEKTERAWLQETGDPARREQLAAACLELDESTSASMRAQGCAWD